MTAPGFTDALAVVLREEGGFVDDPRDPGSVTNLGVTEAVWKQWVGHAVSAATMRGLTPEQVTPLYKSDYWDKVAGDQLPAALALAVFDFAVNHGPHGAAKELQWCLGVAEDGAIGPHTLDAVRSFCAAAGGLRNLIIRYDAARRDFYRSLPTFATFGKGWLARVDYVEGVALSWVG